MMHRTPALLIAGLLLFAPLAAPAPAADKMAAKPAAKAPAEVHFTVVNVEYEKSKLWLPSTLVVKRGTKVVINLINNVPSDPDQHGFSIPDYGIAEIVKRGEPKTVEFVANKAGVFPIICQLHPAHVGGQLVVQ
jgi:nitrosocyanin